MNCQHSVVSIFSKVVCKPVQKLEFKIGISKKDLLLLLHTKRFSGKAFLRHLLYSCYCPGYNVLDDLKTKHCIQYRIHITSQFAKQLKQIGKYQEILKFRRQKSIFVVSFSEIKFQEQRLKLTQKHILYILMVIMNPIFMMVYSCS